MSRVSDENLLQQEEDLLREPEGSANVAVTPEVTPEAPAEPEPEKMLRVQLKDGRQFVGKTQEEIIDALADAAEAAQTPQATQAAQVQEVRRKIRYQEASHRPDPDESYDHQKYVNLMFGGPNGEKPDPFRARAYQDRFYYGLAPEEDPSEAFRFMLKRVDKWDVNSEVAEFQRLNGTTDKDGNPVPLRLSQEDSQTLMKAMSATGQDITTMGLNGMYHALKSQRLIQGPVQTSNVQYEDIRRVSRGATAPRATGGGSSQQATTGMSKTAQELNEMSASDLQAYINKLR